jgi:type IV secretion system protein VirD4
MNRRKIKIIVLTALIGIVLLAALTLTSVIFLFMMQGDVGQARPHTTIAYWRYYNADKRIGDALFASYLLSGVLFGALVALVARPAKKKLFGNYRFAKPADVKKSGLMQAKPGQAGIFLGKYGSHYLFFYGQEFVMVYAPTRSGKGVNMVIPNLLQFPDSVVCLDIKFENYELTSGYRQHHGQKVYLFAPGSPEKKGHRWNPVGYISGDRYDRLTDIDRMSNYLIPTPDNADPMWTSEGRSLFKAVLLLVLDTPHLPGTLGEVLRQLRTERPSKEYFEQIIDQRGAELDPECVRGLSEFINTPDRTAGGIKKSVTGALNAWANPMVDAATEANDFDLRNLRKEKMTIYLGVTQNDLKVFAPVFNLIIQQLIDLNTRKGDLPPRYDDSGRVISGNPQIKHQCLLLLDEFCALGPMEALALAVSYIAGYNLRLMPIFQTEAQLAGTYTGNGAENIIENHAVRVIFPPNRMKHAKAMSEDIGSTTVKQHTITAPRARTHMGTKSVSEAKRPLLLPEEIKAMGDDEQIILSRACSYPIFSKRLFYYKNKWFKNRVMPPAQIPAVKPTDYPVRGKKPPVIQLISDKVKLPPRSNKPLSDTEIDEAVDSFFALANQATEEFEQSNAAVSPEMIAAVDGVFKEMARV